ncbi:MAG TPA: ATP-binding cassette domain-containing protein [Ignavibacteriaceae bacterium]|nr:ATP-binding cassette domain-containing protein [Ignavibacteriaceae bacterium]
MNQNSLLKLESVGKTYSSEAGLNINVLEDINFEIFSSESGTITSILSPFGEGKSTLLKIISGLIEPTSGKIYFNSSEKKKIIPLIPENPSSFPWLSVKKNIEFGLNLSEEKKYTLDDLISIVGLKGYEDHIPHNKSLGFRFRISLARALALNPSLILIDDSLKQMNKESREEIYFLLNEISSHQKQSRPIGIILATTNLVEAIKLSTKIILMSKNPGRIIREIEIDKSDKPQLNDYRSEKFTMLKNEIENAFESLESLTTINYSL